MIKADLPHLKEIVLRNNGKVRFQLIYNDLEAVAIQILSREEILFVTYRDYKKVGFIYDGDKYSFDKIINIYKDIPEDYFGLEEYQEEYKGKIQILYMPFVYSKIPIKK